MVAALGGDADVLSVRRLPAIDPPDGSGGGLRRVRPLLLGLRSRFVLGVEDVVIDLDNDQIIVRYEPAPGAVTLADRLREGPLSLPETVRMAADLCWGLAAGQGAGLWHGRINPADILLGPDDQPARIVGLGLSEISPGPCELPGWTPPEVTAGKPADAASDLWSIGVLFRLCVGRTPLPLNLADLVARLLDRQPERRPDSARAVATRLLGLRTTTRLGAAALAAPRTAVPPFPVQATAERAPVQGPAAVEEPSVQPAAASPAGPAPVVAAEPSPQQPVAAQIAPEAEAPAATPARPAIELPRTGLLAHPLLARLDSSDASGLTEWRARLLRDPLFEPIGPQSLPSARDVLGTEREDEPRLEIDPEALDPLSAPLAVRPSRRGRAARAAAVEASAPPAVESKPEPRATPPTMVETAAAEVEAVETPVPVRAEQHLREIADAVIRRRPQPPVLDEPVVAQTLALGAGLHDHHVDQHAVDDHEVDEHGLGTLEGWSPRPGAVATRHRGTHAARRPRRPSALAAASIVAVVGAAGGSVAYAATGSGHESDTAGTRSLAALVPHAPHSAAATTGSDTTGGTHPRLAPSLSPASVGALSSAASAPSTAVAYAASAHPSASPAVPLPLVAPSSAVANPVQQNALAAVALPAADVAPDAKALTVPEASDFDALLRALYTDCDYYTPVGVTRSAHLLSAFSTGSTVVYDDLSTYPGNTAAGVLNGMATSLTRCRDLDVTQTSHNGTRAAVLGRYRVERTDAPVGLPANAVALTYQRLDQAGTTVRAVLLVQGTTLRVVLASAPTLDDSAAVWAQAAERAWALLQS